MDASLWKSRQEVGTDTEKSMLEWDSSEKKRFYLGACAFYLACAKDLQKLPLDSRVLQCASLLNWQSTNVELEVRALKYLVSQLPQVIKHEEVSSAIDEWHMLKCDSNSDLLALGGERIDVRWGKIFELKSPGAQPKLEVWPGYVQSVSEYDGGLLLNCDVSFRVLRTITAREVLDPPEKDDILRAYSLLVRVDAEAVTSSDTAQMKLSYSLFRFDVYNSYPRDYKAKAVHAIVGAVVMTRYNYHTYRVDDIAWDAKPTSTFTFHTGEDITYVNYYNAEQQCVSDRHPRASQLTTTPQLKPSADSIAVACSAPDHEATAPAVPVPGLIVDLAMVVCGLGVSTCDEAPRRAASFQVVKMTRLVQWGKKTQELVVHGLLPALGDIPFEEYIATDSSVETCGALSDAEIVEMVRPSEPSHETEDDGDPASEPLPRAADVATGLALAQRFFTAESKAEEALGHIYSLQDFFSAARFSKQKQTAITDFFS
ncbi:hypothetical protein HPB51_021961 [Rhipicephalus microplus]|uniref:PAZ domain-containing protein n=1 Tax=Rhipicephalus microplus TaxID=6941 RepID=A0A9J6EJN2_RHIMP|nr:hypothetical protein HPB51_021961 [Rhipicephalus microplus]